jgi:hypothetical protein
MRACAGRSSSLQPRAATPAAPPAPDATTWPTCADDPRATPESLAQKAAVYDARAIALHTTPATP